MQPTTTLQDVTLPATFDALLERLADGDIEPADALLALSRLLNAQFPAEGMSELVWHAQRITLEHADRERRAQTGELTEEERDDLRWQESFAKTADALDRFSEKAKKAYDSGKTRPLTFDE